MPETLRIGLDIGSTTIKCVVLNEADKIIYTSAISPSSRRKRASCSRGLITKSCMARPSA